MFQLTSPPEIDKQEILLCEGKVEINTGPVIVKLSLSYFGLSSY